MNYTSKTIKKALNNCITDISTHKEIYVKNPSKDFTRNRKLPFEQMIKCILAMSGKSINGELMDYFDMAVSTPSVSAFVQQRDKINYCAFEKLFHSFTSTIDKQDLFKGFRLLAVDGSDLHVPSNKTETESFYQNSKGYKPFNLLHLNVLYDLKRNIYTDAIVQPIKYRNEHKAFVTMVDRDDISTPTIYIADRGYESYNNIAHVIEKGQKFLIRVKDVNRCGIVSKLHLPDSNEFDVSVSVDLTRSQTKETKNSNLKFLSHTSPFDFLPKTSRRNIYVPPYHMAFRVIRFKLTDGKYEVLITNLSEEFSVDDLKYIYALRWGIETSFRNLKYSLSLMLFHSKKTEYILQEIFARLTMYNFTQLIISHIIVKQKKRKHSYRINFAVSVHICRNFFLENISPPNIETLLLRNLLPIRQGHTNPRKAHARVAASFLYRIP